MLSRMKAGAHRVLRELATLQLRSLSDEDQAVIVEGCLDSMTTDVETDGLRLRFITPTPILLWRATGLLTKEPETISWIRRFEPDEVFWDIGANVGVYSIYAAAIRRSRVLAFEPSADNYMVLCRNAEVNRLQSRVTPYCIALAGKTELGFLSSNSRGLGAALNQFGARGEKSPYWTNNEGICAQGMVGFRVDDFIQQFAPPFPAHLKLDVDGLELSIIRGAVGTLADRRVKSIMIELNVDDEHEVKTVTSMLSEIGLKLDSRGVMQSSAGTRAQNHLFVR